MTVINHAIRVDNLSDRETVHQRCLLIKGSCAEVVESGFITVLNHDATSSQNFPPQSHPVIEGRFTFLAMLSPGPNRLTIRLGGGGSPELTIPITYIPLLQYPPLHLAILIAKDSPLLIDCPPAKHGGVSTAHSSLDAAIAKFRMTAYMWQALTAEDMRVKGLGRRSFRLEEEWDADTTSQEFLAGQSENALSAGGVVRSTAKIHLIRSDKSVAELRDPNLAQQNPGADSKDKLFDHFLTALKQHGAPFSPSSHPIVAGLILDAHYSVYQDLILAHAALGCHNPAGISLGIFGSHLTYSWPRFVEEVNGCLTDTGAPGATVGNDNGECASMWEACSIGQGAFLHEVGHAFSAPHTTGIMNRGYAQHWPRNFLAKTAYCRQRSEEGFVIVDGQTENNARWDLSDALRFKYFPHFRLPTDKPLTAEVLKEPPRVFVVAGEDEIKASASSTLHLFSRAGIARVTLNGTAESNITPTNPSTEHILVYTKAQLESRFPIGPLSLTVLAMNGKETSIRDVYRLFEPRTTTLLPIPDSDLTLHKHSVLATDMETGTSPFPPPENSWTWAALFTKPSTSTSTTATLTSVDVRTGAYLDGLYLTYADGEVINGGPRVDRYGRGEHMFGGHAAEEVEIPDGEEIVRIAVARSGDVICGMRIYLSGGGEGGKLDGSYGEGEGREVLMLEPPPSHTIIGLFGNSWWGQNFDALYEVGIISAPRAAVGVGGKTLPEAVYEMEELRNGNGGHDEELFREIEEGGVEDGDME
ncbi:hypothetical protein FQN50_001157 [Emmonsiellopsis sp. PD_5]|nr:hypothetical protein FQN50_001157 [Emmonsiellopsis sp. PD_5]